MNEASTLLTPILQYGALGLLGLVLLGVGFVVWRATGWLGKIFERIGGNLDQHAAATKELSTTLQRSELNAIERHHASTAAIKDAIADLDKEQERRMSEIRERIDESAKETRHHINNAVVPIILRRHSPPPDSKQGD